MKLLCRKCGLEITELIPIEYLDFEDIKMLQKQACAVGGFHQIIGVKQRW